MGLLDQVIGGVLGGQQGGAPAGGGSGTSPLMKALMLLLAAKAAHSYMHRNDGTPAPTGGGTAPVPDTSGTINSGMLAGLPNLDTILGKLRAGGHDEKVDSWIGSGGNKAIAPGELENALGPDAVGKLQSQTGMGRSELMDGLAKIFPQVVDGLSPGGKLPSSGERSHW